MACRTARCRSMPTSSASRCSTSSKNIGTRLRCRERFDMPIVSRQLTATSRPLDLLVDIVVCIPSFRRPDHLRKTLQSLADQKIDRRFSVVIVENDAARCESAPVAAEFLQNGALQGICIVEPKQGNCHAINAAFETALVTFPSVKYLLMIDD